MVLVMVKLEATPHERWPRMLKGELKKKLARKLA
jgi:hypothetical protein